MPNWSLKRSDMTGVLQGITVLSATTHEPYLPLLPSRKASPPLGRYQLTLLGEQRHIGVRNLPRVFTLRARPRVEPTTSWSQVRRSTDSATMPRKDFCANANVLTYLQWSGTVWWHRWCTIYKFHSIIKKTQQCITWLGKNQKNMLLLYVLLTVKKPA